MTNEAISVLLVDDHTVVRNGVRLMLGTASDIQVTGEAETAQEALDLVQHQDFNVALVDIALPDRSGLDLLKLQPQTDKHRLGAVGYCFGGKVVLDAARRGEKLDGVVSVHGALVTQTPAQPGQVRAKILVEHGAADSMVTPEQVAAFKQEMASANADLEFVSLPGAKHGFSNPDADRLGHGEHGGPDIGYDKAADQRSWADLQRFFKQVFQQ